MTIFKNSAHVCGKQVKKETDSVRLSRSMIQNKLFQLLRRPHDCGSPGLRQFAGCGVPEELHAHAGKAAFLRTKHIILPVTDHQNGGLIRIGQAQAAHGFPNDIRLFPVGPRRAAGHSGQKGCKAKTPTDAHAQLLRLGGGQRQSVSLGLQPFQNVPNTGGRLISHISLGNVDLSKVSFFILDEADRMLDMGFSDDIKTIASKLPKTCQTIMFSATMPEKIEELAKTLLKNPVEIKLAVSKPAEKIKQEAYVCYETQKMTIIKDIFKAGDLKRVIVFSGSKFKVKQLAASLQQIGVNCGAMHSDLEQAERDDVMFKFKSGQYDVLVATDIVARGIDIDDIEMVINYDVPHDTEDYVHRIGRTARANRDGRAITFVSEEDQYWFQQIEKFLEKVVDKMPLPEGCGEGPEYIKLNKPKKKGANGRNNRRGNGKNGEAGKNSAKNRRQKDRDQTSHKRKPNKPNERQEKAPRSNEQQPQQGNKQQNAKQQPQQGNKQQNAKQQNRKPAQPGEQPKNSNSQKRRNNSNNSNQQRPGNENNVRPGSNGRGRGVAQKKGDKPAARKHTPIVNPQKQENAVKKFIKRIFGFKK